MNRPPTSKGWIRAMLGVYSRACSGAMTYQEKNHYLGNIMKLFTTNRPIAQGTELIPVPLDDSDEPLWSVG